MYENGKIYMGLAGGKRVELALNMCNRHGLIAGASGTGKTITMKVMAESFSDAGVPVLSMHAPYETVAKLDCYMTYKCMKAIFEQA